MNQENKSLDILGIKPIGNAIESLTDGFVSGASAFLSRICLPAAEEFGLLLRDRRRGQELIIDILVCKASNTSE
jgi:hypothetical protein